MKRGFIIIIFTFLLILPVVSASLSSNMVEVERYVGKYKAGELNAPQLVVNIEYIKNKMYEELDKEGRNAFTEAEIVTVFDKVDLGGMGVIYSVRMRQEDWKSTQYEKEFETDDFNVVFRADSFFRYDREYYEKRETTAPNYYIINYELVQIVFFFSSKNNTIQNFD